MIVLNKRAKIITAAALFVMIAAGGFLIERFEKDAFIAETVATEDAVSYVEEGADVSETGLINLNTSDTELLAELDGIGEKLAERIVDYRENHGRYETIEEIMKVPGISEKKFEEIKDDIYVSEE